MKNKPEILAPAGTFDALAAAVYCGADAVYLGSKVLNARRNAGNFDKEELSRAVTFCHLRGVKVYQTLNIVLFPGEEQELIDAIQTAAQLGIDGVMVQDFGVLNIIRACCPELPVFASTQMAVHNLAGAIEAKRLGCRRVVLARELSAREIKNITEQCGVETEVFVHGALCMSVSGQCYLSSMLGGRSGNRGLCAQPCRLPFSCGKSEYALSLKDLSLVERVAQLSDLGVASLKIEGRMKRPEYVAAAVTALYEAREGRQPDMEVLRSVFSRSGFTTGYFDAKRDSGMFGIRQKEDVTSAEKVLAPLALLASRETPRVPLSGQLTAQAGSQVKFTVGDADHHEITVFGPVPEAARNKPTDEERVRQSLGKTGGTPYRFDSLSVALDDGLMLPVSTLNALRREALDKLSKLRSAPRPLPFEPCFSPILPRARENLSPALRIRCRAAQLSDTLLSQARDIILPLGDIEQAVQNGLSPSRVIAEIPRILFEGEQVVAGMLTSLHALGVRRAWCGNVGAFFLARNAGMQAVAGWSANLTNPYSVHAVQEIGAVDAELSFELSLSSARLLDAKIPLGIVAYGRLPLMSFRNCPIRASIGCKACGHRGELRDRKGIRFPVRCRDGISELLNSVPLYLADRRQELSGFSFITLWFQEEDAAQCAQISAQYAGTLPALSPKEGYTRGLYYRAVL